MTVAKTEPLHISAAAEPIEPALKVLTIVPQYRNPVAVKLAMLKAIRPVGPWLVREIGKVEQKSRYLS